MKEFKALKKKIEDLKLWWKAKVRKYKFILVSIKEVFNSAFGNIYNPLSEDEGFLYTREFHPNENYMSVNLRMVPPEGSFGDPFILQKDSYHPMYEDFGRIRGMEKCYRMHSQRYQISFLKGDAFTWKELWPNILKVLEKHLGKNMVSKEIKEPKMPDLEEMRRQDVYDEDRF